MINKYCENCGKIINKKTLICDACGTDYNEKPACEHFYNHYMLMPEPKTASFILGFKCRKCHDTIKLNCDEDMILRLTGGKA